MGLGALCCWMGATFYLRRWQRGARKRPGRESQEEEKPPVLDTAVSDGVLPIPIMA